MHTVLVVDDNQDNLDLARLLLRRRFDVLTASTAGGAIGLARSRHPDLIVSDVRMPGVDGLQLARLLRADPELSDIPLVATTAFHSPVVARAALRAAGFDRLIRKPLDPVHFADEIGELLEPQDR
jgi:CheY-like chemotaxis protein